MNTLSPEQKKWIEHLSDTDEVTIVPFDKTAEEKFQILKEQIQKVLGFEYAIEHRGASNMGISGQDEIDVYIPVSPSEYEKVKELLVQVFGRPGSHYPLERTRFKTAVDDKRIDVFLINTESSGWIDGVIFEKYLQTHHEELEKYRKLKEDCNGLTVREYYNRKILFINNVLEKAKKGV